MNALDMWYECARRKIALSHNDDRLHYDGPPAAVDPMLPIMKTHREALLECVVALNGALFADGPFLPWGPYMNPDLLKQWQRELFDVVDALAKLERWPDDDYDIVIEAIDRQPVSTLRPDLAYFTERLAAARSMHKFAHRP